MNRSSHASNARLASRQSADGYVWNVRGVDLLIHIPQITTGGSMASYVYAWCDYMNALGAARPPKNLGLDNTKTNSNMTTKPLTCLECARW
jgi:hypothetical protein